jgi:biotin carboxyl carrier protein
MYKVLIKGQEIEVTKEDIQNLDISFNKDQAVYQVLENGIAYNISHVTLDPTGKNQLLRINDLNLELSILNLLDQQVDSMGLANIQEQKSNNIFAPMPGLILNIMCKEGDEVHEGTSLLILEAMKMENVIKAEGSGIIGKIHKSVGETVEKGQLILEII